MNDAPWICTRQRAGPLVKECRALRPRLTPYDNRADAREKRELQRGADSAVCHSQIDRLELRLALFGFEGSHYTLTYDDGHLPQNYDALRRSFRAARERVKRRLDEGYDWIGCLEGKHGDHRYHIHLVLRDSEVGARLLRELWPCGEIDREPVLLARGGYRRLAEYFNKERPDGFVIPINKHPWSCSLSLTRALTPPERWQSESGRIEVPQDAIWARRGQKENDFGAYAYASYILGSGALALE